MSESPLVTDRLDSWKEIASYLGRNERTVIRWEKLNGLPVHRIPGGQRKAVFAFREELDAWLTGADGETPTAQTPVNSHGLNGIATGGPTQVEPKAASEDAHSAVGVRTKDGSTSHLKWAGYSTVVFVVASVLIVATCGYVRSRFFLPAPELAGQQQLTANGQEKRGLVTDGKTLYFGQEQDGRFALAAMAVDGGPIRILWSPPANVIPLDVSPDGKRLLAGTAVGTEWDCSLWIVPLDGQKPVRLKDIMGHSAAWAPDGKTIAYSSGNAVYFTSEEEAGSRKAGSFAALPSVLLWSKDGQRLLFVLENSSTRTAECVGEISGDEMKTVTVRNSPSSIRMVDGVYWNRAARWDAYLVLDRLAKLGNTSVTLVQIRTGWWEPAFQVASMGSFVGRVTGIAAWGESSRVFVLSEPQVRTAFVSFDPSAQSFKSILPGASGQFLDFSRDGKWAAYNEYEDGPLWMSRADGSVARRLTPGPENVELPRWSPDGRRIAYTAQRPNRPWRIYIYDLDSGATREASEGEDSEGAPTWSPDGRSLAYGNVNCDGTHSCAIHRIDLASGQVQTVPNSDGLITARWAPDGRFIAAQHLKKHQLMLFDMRTGKWQKVADAIDGTDLSWSADSKYVYANVHGTDPRILRIRVATGEQETILDIRSKDKADMAEMDDLQFSLGPNDTVILHRRIHSEEVYSYELRDR